MITQLKTEVLLMDENKSDKGSKFDKSDISHVKIKAFYEMGSYFTKNENELTNKTMGELVNNIARILL